MTSTKSTPKGCHTSQFLSRVSAWTTFFTPVYPELFTFPHTFRHFAWVSCSKTIYFRSAKIYGRPTDFFSGHSLPPDYAERTSHKNAQQMAPSLTTPNSRNTTSGQTKCKNTNHQKGYHLRDWILRDKTKSASELQKLHKHRLPHLSKNLLRRANKDRFSLMENYLWLALHATNFYIQTKSWLAGLQVSMPAGKVRFLAYVGYTFS